MTGPLPPERELRVPPAAWDQQILEAIRAQATSLDHLGDGLKELAQEVRVALNGQLGTNGGIVGQIADLASRVKGLERIVAGVAAVALVALSPLLTAAIHHGK